MNSPRYPDLEIYVQSLDLDRITGALETLFAIDIWTERKNTRSTNITTAAGRADIIVSAEAYQDYSSVWLKTNVTEFDTDFDFAEAISQTLPDLIRCSQGSWDDQTSDQEALWFWFENGQHGLSRWD